MSPASYRAAPPRVGASKPTGPIGATPNRGRRLRPRPSPGGVDRLVGDGVGAAVVGPLRAVVLRRGAGPSPGPAPIVAKSPVLYAACSSAQRGVELRARRPHRARRRRRGGRRRAARRASGRCRRRGRVSAPRHPALPLAAVAPAPTGLRSVKRVGQRRAVADLVAVGDEHRVAASGTPSAAGPCDVERLDVEERLADRQRQQVAVHDLSTAAADRAASDVLRDRRRSR